MMCSAVQGSAVPQSSNYYRHRAVTHTSHDPHFFFILVTVSLLLSVFFSLPARPTQSLSQSLSNSLSSLSLSLPSALHRPCIYSLGALPPRDFKATGVSGAGSVFMRAVESWVTDIYSNQMHQVCVGSIEEEEEE